MSDQDAKQLVDKLMEASPFQSGEWDQQPQGEKKAEDPVVEFTDKTKLLEVESGERCPDCSVALFVDPPRESLFIWLHAWKYQGPGWEYETELPEWAHSTLASP